MIFLVNDANILIDLLKIDLIEPFFQLDYDFLVTDLAFVEILEANRSDLDIFISRGVLSVHNFYFDDLLRIQLIEVDNPGLSIADCSCLYLSQIKSAILLTGDAALRRIAQQSGITVHGILWIFDEMVNNGILPPNVVADKLCRLMEINLRLPIRECKKRIRAWRLDG